MGGGAAYPITFSREKGSRGSLGKFDVWHQSWGASQTGVWLLPEKPKRSIWISWLFQWLRWRISGCTGCLPIRTCWAKSVSIFLMELMWITWGWGLVWHHLEPAQEDHMEGCVERRLGKTEATIQRKLPQLYHRKYCWTVPTKPPKNPQKGPGESQH